MTWRFSKTMDKPRISTKNPPATYPTFPQNSGVGSYIDTAIIPNTTATSVVVISRVRRLKRRDHGSQGAAESIATMQRRNQCGAATIGPNSQLQKKSDGFKPERDLISHLSILCILHRAFD